NFGYLQQIFVAETEEKAQALGKAALFGGGAANFSRPEWTLPPGYNSKEATRVSRARHPTTASSASPAISSRRAATTITAKTRVASCAAVRSVSRKRSAKSTGLIKRRRTACRSSSGLPSRYFPSCV